jgi:hypothetical protein
LRNSTSFDVVTYNDVYGRDGPVRQALNAAPRQAVQQASN